MIDFAKEAALRKAARWCAIFARKLKPIGWHVALTGSALYGREDGKAPEDVDIILYPHNDDREHNEDFADLLAAINPEAEFQALTGNDYERPVYRVIAKDGTQIDFWMLFDEDNGDI